MKLKIIIYKTLNNQVIISLPSSLVEKYGMEGDFDFKIDKEPFSTKVIRDTKLNKDGSTNVRGVITVPKKISDFLRLENKQEVELMIKGI